MAAYTDFSPPFAIVEGGHSKENTSAVKDELLEGSNELKQTIDKPPRDLSVVQHSASSAALVADTDLDCEITEKGFQHPSKGQSDFEPIFRSGSCAEKGPKQYMEDEHICIDDLVIHVNEIAGSTFPAAFYGVFDGHGGTDAALFVRNNILKFIIEEPCFPMCLEKAIKNAFLKADYAFADDSSIDISSGTTALTALMFGRTMIVANAGDCRAVLGKRGRAIELSKEHKPSSSTSERY